MMEKGFAELDAQIARLRELPGLTLQAAPDVAVAVEREIQRTIAAGSSSDGEVWQPKQDGGKPLATAARALAVVSIGSRVFARIRGHIARHHLGRAKGGIERPILPTDGIPAPMAKAITKVIAKRFNETMGG